MIFIEVLLYRLALYDSLISLNIPGIIIDKKSEYTPIELLAYNDV